MTKLLKMGGLLAVLIMVVALIVTSVSAGSLATSEDEDPDNEGETETSLTENEEDPEGAAVRINFEISGHVTREGLYVVEEASGRQLDSWYAAAGWQDSDWLDNLTLSYEAVYVRVLYYPGPDTTPTEMIILNHAPDTDYGWAARGTEHALEVAWPDMPLAGSSGTAATSMAAGD